jgi:hypothetical protein
MPTEIDTASKIHTVTDYFLDRLAAGEEVPCHVVLALLRIRWPDRSFSLYAAPDDDFVGVVSVTLDSFMDAATGKSAEELDREFSNKSDP